MPAAKKDPSTRARANRAATASTLSSTRKVKDVPGLPERDWHLQTVSWWADLWASPMAPEYAESDRHALFVLAYLVDDFWAAGSSSERAKLACEIRLQRVAFGLTPYDRRRLEWTIEQSDEAQDRGRRRRSASSQAPAVKGAEDPRSVLRLA